MKYRLTDAEFKSDNYKEENEILKSQILELEFSKKNLEEKIDTNKEIVELYSKLEVSEKDLNLKETISEFLKKNDGLTSLTTYVFVLHEKIKNFQEENTDCKY